jgi:SAM-dependent methyltransferase
LPAAPMTTQSLTLPVLKRASRGPETWDYAETAEAILAHHDPRSSTARPYRMLEAGGGSDSWLPLPPGAEITTIDISPEQLEMNTYTKEKLLGDLETFDYGTRRFDLVVCWDVLEHLKQPESAIERLAGVVAPGGRLIIKGPLPQSLKGLVTRLSPHSLHVQFYRRILGSKTAGLPGHPPFRAHLKPGSSPGTIAQLLSRCGFAVDTLEGYESGQVSAIAAKGRLAISLYRMTETALWALTLGRSRRRMTDFYLIARRPAEGCAG